MISDSPQHLLNHSAEHSEQEKTARQENTKKRKLHSESMPMSTLLARRTRLKHMEDSIRMYLTAHKYFVVGVIVNVAAALRCISEEKLFMVSNDKGGEYKNIYAYSKEVLGFTRRTTNTYVYESITEDKTLPVPSNISHIRSLHKFPPEDRRTIWRLVTESGVPITEDNVLAMALKFETGSTFTDVGDELFAPIDLILAGRRVLNKDAFDLDPATSHLANIREGIRVADNFYTELQNGLLQNWYGDIWLFPPSGNHIEGYSRQGEWFKSAERRFLTGEITSCHILLRVEPGSHWFPQVYRYPHCMLHDRLKFSTPTGREKSLTDTAFVLIYMGPKITIFCEMFGAFGLVPGYNSWSFVGQKPSEPTVPAQEYTNKVAPTLGHPALDIVTPACPKTNYDGLGLVESYDNGYFPIQHELNFQSLHSAGPQTPLIWTDKLTPTMP